MCSINSKCGCNLRVSQVHLLHEVSLDHNASLRTAMDFLVLTSTGIYLWSMGIWLWYNGCDCGEYLKYSWAPEYRNALGNLQLEMQIHSLLPKKPLWETSLVVQWLRHRASNAGGPGSIPRQGSRSHILQLRVLMPQLKDPAWYN